MKKLVSLLLALAMCLCALTPALAEGGVGTAAEAEVFPYSFEDYKNLFDTLSANMLQVTPVWSEADGNHVATVAGYGDVVVEMNAQGQITRLATEQSFTMATLSNASNFGMLVAMTATASRTAEDPNFFVTVDARTYSAELVGSLQTLMNRMSEAIVAPISSTAVVYGDTVTFTCSLNAATMSVTFGFIYEPGSTGVAETAPAAPADPAATAATAPAAFDCDLAGVQQWFEPFASGMGIAVTWTVSEDGLTATATAESISPIVITMNDEGKVTGVTTKVNISALNVQAGATAFGFSIALASIAVKTAEDYTFMADQTNLSQMQADLNGLLGSVTSRGAEAVAGPVSDTVMLGGHPCTITMSIDPATMFLVLSYSYQP